jgi:hypothetical protein
MLLSVLMARSLVILADALEAAAAAAGVPAADHLAAAVFARPVFMVPAAHAQSARGKITYRVQSDILLDYPHEPGSEKLALATELFWGVNWRIGIEIIVESAVSQLMRAKRFKDAACLAQFAASISTSSTLDAQTAAAAPASGCSGNCGGGSSSSSTEAVRWAYLLPEQLLRSKKLAAAVTGFEALKLASGSSSMRQFMQEEPHVQNIGLQLCRVLAGAAPLPQLCNNLCCSSLAAGGTEAAAAVKVCSGCGAWYCSADCAAAHWRQHKKACRRMAALGLNLNA